jgi:hypothetical protein
MTEPQDDLLGENRAGRRLPAHGGLTMAPEQIAERIMSFGRGEILRREQHFIIMTRRNYLGLLRGYYFINCRRLHSGTSCAVTISEWLNPRQRTIPLPRYEREAMGI